MFAQVSEPLVPGTDPPLGHTVKLDRNGIHPMMKQRRTGKYVCMCGLTSMSVCVCVCVCVCGVKMKMKKKKDMKISLY